MASRTGLMSAAGNTDEGKDAHPGTSAKKLVRKPLVPGRLASKENIKPRQISKSNLQTSLYGPTTSKTVPISKKPLVKTVIHKAHVVSTKAPLVKSELGTVEEVQLKPQDVIQSLELKPSKVDEQMMSVKEVKQCFGEILEAIGAQAKQREDQNLLLHALASKVDIQGQRLIQMENVIVDMSERLEQKESKSEMILEVNNDRLASIDKGVRQIKEKESEITDILQFKVASNEIVKNIIVEGVADVAALHGKSDQGDNQKKMDNILQKSVETKDEVVNILERVAALVERVTCFVEKKEETNQNDKNKVTDALEKSIAVNDQVVDTIVRLSGLVKEVATYVQEKERCKTENESGTVACASLAQKEEVGDSSISVQKTTHGNDTEHIKAKLEKVLTKIVETRGHMRSVMARVNGVCDNQVEFSQIEELKDQIHRMRFSLEGMISLISAPPQYDGAW